MAHLFLENVGPEPLEVMSHVNAGELHLDWFAILLREASGSRRIALLDARDRSTPVKARLAPAELLRHAVDVAAWAAREVNGARPLAAGDHEARAIYEVGSESGCWTGRLQAGPVTLTVCGSSPSESTPAGRTPTPIEHR